MVSETHLSNPQSVNYGPRYSSPYLNHCIGMPDHKPGMRCYDIELCNVYSRLAAESSYTNTIIAQLTIASLNEYRIIVEFGRSLLISMWNTT